ncbi:unnamed protein product [Mytilus coruscus]|uniref:Uncharacterized protein n=1 Tax=Mytilus coruscus TaxID=42192 RepID=A0A6J8CA35_MYTCO|nr:unnamed protein product [Mytilus coruscus]
MVPKPANQIADEVIIDEDEMVEVEPAREELWDSYWESRICLQFVLECEDIRGHTDEQSSPTSWNVITHVAPRCSLRILWLEPESVLIPVASPELPRNNQPEHCTTVVHRARLFSVMVPKPAYQIDDDVIIDEDEMVELDPARKKFWDRFKMQKRSAMK